MTEQTTARVSPRWTEPEKSPDGSYWRAYLRESDAANVLEGRAYGPDRDACIREITRHDRNWALEPLRRDDAETARARLRYLVGDAGGDQR